MREPLGSRAPPKGPSLSEERNTDYHNEANGICGAEARVPRPPCNFGGRSPGFLCSSLKPWRGP